MTPDNFHSGSDTMLRNTLFRTATLVAAAAFVSSCGGGNDTDAGSLTAFNVVPASVSLKGPNENTCGSGFASRVFVYGGAGPYRIDNTLPGSLAVSKATLDRPGDSFDVAVLTTGCMTNIPIVVIDQVGRQTTFSVTTVKGDPPVP
jgi:hypothetical protein